MGTLHTGSHLHVGDPEEVGVGATLQPLGVDILVFRQR